MNGSNEASDIRRVDCDIHPIFSGGLRDLAPYLSDDMRARFGMQGPVETDQFGGKREATIEVPRSPFFFPVVGDAARATRSPRPRSDAHRPRRN